MLKLLSLGLALAFGLAACTTAKPPQAGPGISYYEIGGTTAAELNYELFHKAPLVDGKYRALAAANVTITPTVSLEGGTDSCVVASATAKLNANITHPRRRHQHTGQAELDKAWGNLEEYARVHELTHVAIAKQHAEMLQARLRALPVQDSCTALRARVTETIEEVLALNAQAQNAFEGGEQERIAQLVRQVQPKSD